MGCSSWIMLCRYWLGLSYGVCDVFIRPFNLNSNKPCSRKIIRHLRLHIRAHHVPPPVRFRITPITLTTALSFILRSRGVQSKPRIAMLAVTILLFTMSTLLLALPLYIAIQSAIDSLLQQTTGEGLRPIGASTDKVLPIIYTADWVFPLEVSQGPF
jgi:hypothetical protein